MSFSFRNIFSPDEPEFELPSPSMKGATERGNWEEEGEDFAPPFLTFLASELLPYIPKAIAALSGIPMEKEVRVPLSADGGLDVALSEIYRVCPELFAAEITPLNDSVVTLPPRLGAMPATSNTKTSAASHSFWASLSQESTPSDALFPESSAPAGSPVSGNDPFSGTFDSSSISWKGEGLAGDAVDSPPSDFDAPPTKVDESTGLAPPFAPTGEKPTLFSMTADEDQSIPFPQPDRSDDSNPPRPNQGADDRDAKTKESSGGVWGTMFQGTAYSEGPEEVPFATDAAPFASIGKLQQGTPPLPLEAAGTEPAHVFEPVDDESAPATGLFSAPAEPAALPENEKDPVPALGFVSFRPEAPTAPDLGETGPIRESVEPRPASAPTSLASDTLSPSSPMESPSPTEPFRDDDRDLVLRALFSTSESFDLDRVARSVADLPGIKSCSLATPGAQAHFSHAEGNRSGEEVREMVGAVRSLARLTGLPDAKAFTLQTDRGVVSLFLEGECCVAVQQETTPFQPGVREKLILISRNLVKLQE